MNILITIYVTIRFSLQTDAFTHRAQVRHLEYCPYLAKKSLFRPIGERSERPEISALEEELMEKINELGIGPQGYGGSTTALDVKIEIGACHIAALPVAVNLNYHASHHKEVVL